MEAVERGWLRLRAWKGPGLLTDYRAEANRPLLMIDGWHALGGFEVPFLPEPYDDGDMRSRRSDGFRQELLRGLRRMVYGLFVPELWRGAAWERQSASTTFDLRLVSQPAQRGPGRLRVFMLAKVFAPVFDSRSKEKAPQIAAEAAEGACRLIRAIAPHVLSLQPLGWRVADGPTNTGKAHWLPVTDSELGLAPEFPVLGELRRENFLTVLQMPESYEQFGQRLDAYPPPEEIPPILPIYWAAARWPIADHDLLPTCSVMASSDKPLVLSVRLQPTLRTRHEHRAILDRQSDLAKWAEKRPRGLARVKRLIDQLGSLVRRRELFWAAIQVAGSHAGTISEVLATLAGEYTVGRVAGQPARGVSLTPARVLCIHPKETTIAAFNLTNVEMWPWGGLNTETRAAAQPDGSIPAGCPDLSDFTPPQELKNPEVFLHRDLEYNLNLIRLRSLLSLEEAATLWRLPVVGSGGQAGLASRLPNPFEQLPGDTPPEPDTVSLGMVQHRGLSTSQEYRVPLGRRLGRQAGIGDRVLVVAGSPGSGKTNFALNFLEQLWNPRLPREERTPYLVIDPTRGQEFRWLLRGEAAGDELVVFTVGNPYGVPFCFNPFIVPKRVSLQSHISRLMSCFRAVYIMWDPLPAVFEEAIRQAYQDKFRESNKPWDPAGEIGTGMAEDYPNLEDVCKAMGQGTPNEKGTVLARQRQIWSANGQGTENQATIVASTSLRLKNLYENYDYILGGPRLGRSAIDLNKLLRAPAVLELGMIGDSQALSLVMAFLVVSLAGCIETRDRRTDPLHVLVIEEAHRLLSAEGGVVQERGNARLQAAEDINKLLAEVRHYGQGVMLLDQRPGSLVGGVIDNAYLVALHRLNERKSFEQFADMLNLTPPQRRFARIGLQPGEAVILDRVSGMPVVLRPEEKSKDQVKGANLGDDAWLKQRSHRLLEALQLNPPGEEKSAMLQ